VLLCLGAAAIASPLRTPLPALYIDLGALVLMTATMAMFIRRRSVIGGRAGALAVGIYLLFTVITILRG
jgi:Ca2+/Na+ antiporter